MLLYHDRKTRPKSDHVGLQTLKIIDEHILPNVCKPDFFKPESIISIGHLEMQEGVNVHM